MEALSSTLSLNIIFSKTEEKSGEVCLYLLQSAGNNFFTFVKFLVRGSDQVWH